MMMSSNDVNALLSDDVIYHILLCLRAKTLLRFKSVRKSWCDLIESSDFIKEHLHHHHRRHPRLRNENHNLIFWILTDDLPITFPITSVHNFEAPSTYLQLDCPNLHEYFPAKVCVAIFDGIICLHISEEDYRPKNTVCLWNPATKHYRLLPQSPFSPAQGVEDHYQPIAVGFGFDVKTNDYKVVRLTRSHEEKRVEAYSLSTDSWRRVDTVFPVDFFYSADHPKMPFRNGTCFCWMGHDTEFEPWIFCFDFSLETFRSVPLPNINHDLMWRRLSILRDKIACIFSLISGVYNIGAEVWVFNDYGCVNESWAKFYSIDDPCSRIDRFMCPIWLSMDGNYLFFGSMQICRYDLVTEEKIFFSCPEFQENLKNCRLLKNHFWVNETVAEYKESLVSLARGNDGPTCFKQPQ